MKRELAFLICMVMVLSLSRLAEPLADWKGYNQGRAEPEYANPKRRHTRNLGPPALFFAPISALVWINKPHYIGYCLLTLKKNPLPQICAQYNSQISKVF